jgi:hypothetical protein
MWHAEAVRYHEMQSDGLLRIKCGLWTGFPEEENTIQPAAQVIEDCEELPRLVFQCIGLQSESQVMQAYHTTRRSLLPTCIVSMLLVPGYAEQLLCPGSLPAVDW